MGDNTTVVSAAKEPFRHFFYELGEMCVVGIGKQTERLGFCLIIHIRINFPLILLYLFCLLVWGLHLPELRSFSWLCTQGSLLMGFWGPYGVLDIEPRLAIGKTGTHPLYYHSVTNFLLIFKKHWELCSVVDALL